MRKSAAIIFSYAFLVFALCLGISAFIGRVPSVLEEYRRTYIFCRGFLYFFRLLPAVLSSGFLVALSIYFGIDSEKAQMRFSPVIVKDFKRTLILSLILVSVMSGVSEIAAPVVQRKKNFAENSERLLTEYIQLGNESLAAENYVLAHRYGTQILKIRPASSEGKNLIDKSEAVLKAIKKISPETEKVKIGGNLNIFDEISGETVTSLINKSKMAAEKGKWFDSHYFAQLATTTGSEKDINIKEAHRLASQAWNILQSVSPSAKTRDQILFAKKRSAYKALSEGDNIEAYYRFVEISKQDIEWASDPDVTEFLTIARNRMEKQCFFIDETDSLRIFENFLNVYFTVKHSDGRTDVVYIQGITPVYDNGGMVQYLRGLTVTTFAKNGSFIKSFSVPYAKMLSVAVSSFDENLRAQLDLPQKVKRVPYILLKSLDRNGREKIILPKYEFSDSLHPDQKTQPVSTVLAMSVEDFFTACEQSAGLRTMPLNTLLKTAGKAQNFGFSNEISGAFLIKRITYPLIMMTILVFFAGLAWNFRIHKEQVFKFVWVFIIPFCALACDAFIQIILSIAELFNFMLVSVAGTVSLLVALGFWIVVFFFAVFYFVTRKTN